jgi:hypothetical protein
VGTRLALGETGKQMATLLGPQWDLLGFDPRGIGRTRFEYAPHTGFLRSDTLCRPNVHCFPDDASQCEHVHHLHGLPLAALTVPLAAFYMNTMFERAYDVPNIANASDPANFPALVVQQRQFLAIKEAQARACQDNMDIDELRYMGTASVVRDMDFMTKVLDGADAKM